MRAGIHVGRIRIEEEDAFGLSVNFAARVVGAAKGAQIFVSTDAKKEIDEEKPKRFDDLIWTEHTTEIKEGLARVWEATRLLRGDDTEKDSGGTAKGDPATP